MGKFGEGHNKRATLRGKMHFVILHSEVQTLQDLAMLPFATSTQI